jgi:adenylate cyclase
MEYPSGGKAVTDRVPQRRERRLAAILSTDAVGYSQRMAVDETTTMETLRAHRSTIGGVVREHRGRVVDAVGDNLLAEFPSAVDAVACALRAQQLLAERNATLPEDHRLPFRIGLHVGDLLVDGEQIFGDGINVAARLEALAEPGGICASQALVEQVRGKIEARFEDVGMRELKHIPTPVHVWRLRAKGAEAVVRTPPSVPGFADRPAIAVLPFENRTGDPDQEFLVDGIAEDVTARLAAFRIFPVIARSSSFTYKGKRIDPRQLCLELGAQYIVEGSVRKAGSRIRLLVELVDGSTGHQIHAERYDRELGDVFALQDEIAESLVGSIEPTLARAEQRRAGSKPTERLDAWECLHRGYAHFHRQTAPDWGEADRLFRRAGELDPGFATAQAMIAFNLWSGVFHSWTEEAERLLPEARRIAQGAVALDGENALAQVALGWSSWYLEGRETALRAFERAVELNPSLVWGHLGMATLMNDDEPEAALATAEKTIRLSPRDPMLATMLHGCALPCFVLGRDEQALEWEQRAAAQPNAGPQIYRLLGAALGHLGRTSEARAALDEAMRRAPGFDLDTLRARNSPRLVERLLEGWKKAGWAPPA